MSERDGITPLPLFVTFCPECGAQQQGVGGSRTETHFMGPGEPCPAQGTIYVPVTAEVVLKSAVLEMKTGVAAARARIDQILDEPAVALDLDPEVRGRIDNVLDGLAALQAGTRRQQERTDA